MLDLMTPFDAVHFMNTISNGYVTELNHAFFPLTGYVVDRVMVLWKPLGYLMGWERVVLIKVVGVVLSNLTSLAGVVVFYKVCKSLTT
jgi:hypothetical protein